MFDLFISHTQRSGGDQAHSLYLDLIQHGYTVWYDNYAKDLTEHGMEQGIRNCRVFLIFLSEGIFKSRYCCFEIMKAIQYKKKIVLVHETDKRHQAFDFDLSKVPKKFHTLLRNHESIAYRRRQFERKAMLDQLMAQLPTKSKPRKRTLVHSESTEVTKWLHRALREYANDHTYKARKCIQHCTLQKTNKNICKRIRLLHIRILVKLVRKHLRKGHYQQANHYLYELLEFGTLSSEHQRRLLEMIHYIHALE